MAETHSIAHRIEFDASPRQLFDALAKRDGLRGWWTPMVETEPAVGQDVAIRFGNGEHGPDMRVDELEQDRKVVWTCTGAPWPGMRFVFSIEPHERGAVLHFDHAGWPEVDDFYRHCNSKWGYFLTVSLKAFVETGRGAPHPQDPSI